MNEFNTEQQTGQQPGQVPPPNYPYPPQAPSAKRLGKSPGLATLFSCFPGLGQVYVGYYQTGFTFAAVVAFTIALLNAGIGGALQALFGVSLAFFWIFNMIDANRRAHHYNRALAGQGGETVPEDFKLPSRRGSMPAGVVLIVLGLLVTLDINEMVSLSWLEDWWPLMLVVFGGWLVFKGRRPAE